MPVLELVDIATISIITKLKHCVFLCLNDTKDVQLETQNGHFLYNVYSILWNIN